MAITIEDFRKAAAQRRRGVTQGARKYDPELVEFALAHAQNASSQGRSLHATANELGISAMTLRAWQQSTGAATRKLRSVVVSEPEAPRQNPALQSTLTLTTSRGYVVGGLDLAQLIALLQALS